MKEEILNLIKEGKTNDEILNLLNCTNQSIKKYRRFSNLTDDSNVIELRKNGKTYDDIYNILEGGKTKEQIRMICSKNGLSVTIFSNF